MINLEKKSLHLLNSILKKFIPHCSVWLFGSRTTDNIKPHSDIDLAIITQTPLDINIMTELTIALSDSDLPYKVDLIDWSSIDADFKKIIQKKHEIIQLADLNPL
ncbi:MAG: nucleotidyltransferase domain-containing protein [Gammaproteobacteria bacterium]|nr:nucleotidyltransferase domain-containing protein [Gammaproteobacteria bacterium]